MYNSTSTNLVDVELFMVEKMKKMKILLDCDGVIVNFSQRVLDTINEKYNTTYTVNDINEFSISDSLRLSQDQRLYLKDEINKAGWRLGCKRMIGATQLYNSLSKIADVLIVTAPMYTQTWWYETVGLLGSRFGVKYDDIIFASKKQFVDGYVLIDDKPGNCIAWSEYNSKISIMPRRRYNLNVRNPNVMYAENNREIVEITRRIVGESK